MRTNAVRVIAAATLVLAPALAAHAREMYTPGLPSAAHYLECRIINVTATPKSVTTEAIASTGATSGGPYTQTLAPGEAGGFSLPPGTGSVYCKFTVSGSADGYRTSIDVLDPFAPGGFSILVALPGS